MSRTTSPCGRITVTVSGALPTVALTPESGRIPPAELSALIVTTVHSALSTVDSPEPPDLSEILDRLRAQRDALQPSSPGTAAIDYAISTLERLRRTGSAPEDIVACASNADASIVVTATADAPVESLSLSRAAVSLGSELLAEELNRAIADAAEDLRRRQDGALDKLGLPMTAAQASALDARAKTFARGTFARTARIHAEHAALTHRLHTR